jgi:membrane associated rhomboid family serine protease
LSPKDVSLPAGRERAFNAPVVVIGLALVLIAAHAARPLLGENVADLVLARGDLQHGRLLGLVGHIFVHASWPHVLINSVFILAFGAPVARAFGETAWGGVVFLAFFLICGVLAALGFIAMADAQGWLLGTAQTDWSLAGASGAASGLMGAAIRLMAGRTTGEGALGGLASRLVVSASLGWILINLVLGLTGLTPGAGGAPVAWQAHIAGYFAGLLLIGLFIRFAGARRVAIG